MRFTLEMFRESARAIIADIINEIDSNNRLVVTNTDIGKFIIQFADEIGGPGGKADVYLFGKLIRTVRLKDAGDIHIPEWKTKQHSSMSRAIGMILFHCMWEAQCINSVIDNLWKQGNGSVELLNGMRLRSEVIHRRGGDRCFTLSDEEGSLFSTSVYFGKTGDMINQIHYRWIPPGLFSVPTRGFEFNPTWEKHAKNFLLEILP